ncbi:hypothetical protein E3N88_20446 [Mikania micrantha]|uniref:Uncharacterized protein n=1 Tax=Mikania micrantha TaxID=192012 RepID=A0A5N6NIV7_9ASTR|nr:hypothetical protein E3N88_20446 [Mikania micrantha]
MHAQPPISKKKIVNESFVRLEFQFQTVFNELQLIRTTWETFQSPTPTLTPTTKAKSPTSAGTSSLATQATKQAPSTTVSAPDLATKQAPFPASFAPKSMPTRAQCDALKAPVTFIERRSLKINNHEFGHLLKSCDISKRSNFTKVASYFQQIPRLLMYLNAFEDPFQIIEDIIHKWVPKNSSKKHEWHPPWCFTNATPNAAGRVEWRPPWQLPSLFNFFLP